MIVPRTCLRKYLSPVHSRLRKIARGLQVRVFDSMGLDGYSSYEDLAMGVKLVAAGFHKENCEMKYLTKKQLEEPLSR